MLDRSLATLNDLLHAAIVGAVLVVSTLGVSEEFVGWDSDQVLSIAAAAVTGASAAYGATLTPPGMHCSRDVAILAARG
jgi:preprotein translocase subunit SecD